jgi:uncharacterized delta-60 repeat protein
VLLACLTIACVAASSTPQLDYRAAPGRVAMTVGQAHEATFTAVAPLDDGAVLVGGQQLYRDAGQRPYERLTPVLRAFVVKLTRDGRVDRRYGDGGVTWLDGSSPDRIAARGDGSATVVMAARGQASSVRIVRLTPRGALDRDFGRGGALDLAGVTTSNPYDDALAPDGSAVVAGRSASRAARGVLARITPGGTLDPGFGTGGLVELVDDLGVVEAIAIAPGGALLLLTKTGDGTGVLRRYARDGSVDAGFGGGTGAVVAPPGAYTVTVDQRGRIWMRAVAIQDPDDESADVPDHVWRLLSDGSRDPAFDARLAVTPPYAGGTLIPEHRGALAVLADLAARVRVIRIGEDGSVTRDEKLRTHLGGGDNRGRGMRGAGFRARTDAAAAVRPDGSIVVVGYTVLRKDFHDWAEPAIVVVRKGGGLERGFGRRTGPPHVRLGPLRRQRRLLTARLRTETRGLGDVSVRRRRATIAHARVAFLRPGGSSRTLRMKLNKTGRRLLASGARVAVTVHVAVDDMAGNVRRVTVSRSFRPGRMRRP